MMSRKSPWCDSPVTPRWQHLLDTIMLSQSTWCWLVTLMSAYILGIRVMTTGQYNVGSNNTGHRDVADLTVVFPTVCNITTWHHDVGWSIVVLPASGCPEVGSITVLFPWSQVNHHDAAKVPRSRHQRCTPLLTVPVTLLYWARHGNVTAILSVPREIGLGTLIPCLYRRGMCPGHWQYNLFGIHRLKWYLHLWGPDSGQREYGWGALYRRLPLLTSIYTRYKHILDISIYSL